MMPTAAAEVIAHQMTADFFGRAGPVTARTTA